MINDTNKYFLMFFIIACSVFINTSATCQNFYFTPSKNFIAYVDTNQINYNGIEINNVGNLNLDFSWELVFKDTLNDCEFDLCNSGICFNNLPVNGVMPTILPGQKGFLKMHMFSGQTIGTNVIKYVLRNSSLNTSDTLTYTINVGSITGIHKNQIVQFDVVLFPNPTLNETSVNITVVKSSDVTVSVLNNVGQIVYQIISALSAGSNKLNIDTKQFAAGIYNVVIATENGSVTKKLSVTK